MNFKLLIQFDGTDFHGWQVQENDRTIQGELERVIGMLVDAEVSVIGSGRTDAASSRSRRTRSTSCSSRRWTCARA